MSLRIRRPEIFGVTETSLTVGFSLDDDGRAVEEEARVLVDGEVRATSQHAGVGRLVRIEGLEPGREHRVAIEADGAEPPPPDRYFPETVRTLEAPTAGEVARIATLNDLHFGEPRFGGILQEDGEYGPVADGFPEVRDDETESPYWQFMNEDAIAEINASGVDAVFIKGDIADRGLPEQFEIARRTFAAIEAPHHAFLGNHDYYASADGVPVDGYALLGQPAAPRSVDLGGWRLLLLETAEPGEHHGVFGDERLAWLEAQLDATREEGLPTLLLMHHQPVPPEHADGYPNSIGLDPRHSLRLFERLGHHPQLAGVLIGHTHRNRVRHHPASGSLPFVEVACTKDYPGAWGHYRLFDDGSFRQEVRRTSSARALAHTTRCRDFFRGGYRDFALGALPQRSFAARR